MKNIDKTGLEKYSLVFKALSHPTRLWMVFELMESEHSVCEFVETSGLDFSTVSKHLSILKQARILEDDKRGKHVFYSLRATCMPRLIACMEHMTKE